MHRKSSDIFDHEANCDYLPVTFLFFTFSLNDAIDFLMNTEDNSDIESFSNEDDYDLAMLPLIKKANAETDMVSDVSDDMNDGLVHHLPWWLLISTFESSLLKKRNQEKSVQHTQAPNKKSRKSAARNWKKDTDLQPIL